MARSAPRRLDGRAIPGAAVSEADAADRGRWVSSMQAKVREKSGHFWWRAAEPIPNRPEALAPIGDSHEPTGSPPAITPANDRPRDSQPVDAPRESSGLRRARLVELGAFRPSMPQELPPARSASPRQPPVDVDPVEAASDVSADAPSDAFRGLPPRPLVRRNRRSRHALLAAGLAGALLFAAATGFGSHVRQVDSLSRGIDGFLVAAGFGINEISLSGHRHTLDQDVFRALGASGATLLSFDVEAARRRIEALSWIESATLVRVFPDKLRVEMRERSPAAVWLDGERTALVDGQGRVLSYLGSFVPPELPRLAGPGAPAAAAELRAALQRFPAVADRLRVSHRVGERRWDLELSDGTTVRLAAGPLEPSLERLVRLEEETRGFDHAGKVIDLTVAKSIAVSTPVPAAGVSPRPAPHPPARPL